MKRKLNKKLINRLKIRKRKNHRKYLFKIQQSNLQILKIKISKQSKMNES